MLPSTPQDVVADGILIVLMNSFFSIISGMTIFSVLGFMAAQVWHAACCD
jgi:SNF family Na+-dependent transporter